jgi:hypothetical protein
MRRLQFLRSLPLIQSHKSYARGSLMLVGQRTWAVDALHGRLHGYNIGHDAFLPPINLHLPMRHWSPKSGGRAVVLSSFATAANNDAITIAVMDCDVAVMTVSPNKEFINREHTLLSPATCAPFKDMVFHTGLLWLCTKRDVFSWSGKDAAQPLLRFSITYCIQHIQKGRTLNTVSLFTECNRILECDSRGNILQNFACGHASLVFDGDRTVVQNAYSTALQNERMSVMTTDDRISVARLL